MIKPSLNNTQEYLEYLTALSEANKNGANTAWISSCTYLVFLMQAGFTLLESGATRHKNYASALVKNTIVATTSTLCWWLIGYGFAFGESKKGVIGTSHFAGHKIETFDQYNNWMFQWAFAGTSATIVSGCILERVTFWGFVLYSSFMTSWIYPLIVHWGWSDHGWLKGLGYLDFAGSGVVHMVGGAAGFAATVFIKPRIGRFPAGKIDKEEEKAIAKEFKPNYVPFVCLGTLLLWFCWYGFNCGSTVNVVGKENSILVGKIGMNTGIAASAGGITAFTFVYFLNRGSEDEYSVSALCNGVLAGLVGVTASCNVITSWAAFIIGIISAFIYLGYSKLLAWKKIDDPLDASPIHMGCGSWGIVAVGWFHPSHGILYGHGGRLFGIQFLAAIVIFAWTTTNTIVFFFMLKICNLHRISPEYEIKGLDSKCGGLVHQYDIISANYYSTILFPKTIQPHCKVGSADVLIPPAVSEKEEEEKENIERAEGLVIRNASLEEVNNGEEEPVATEQAEEVIRIE